MKRNNQDTAQKQKDVMPRIFSHEARVGAMKEILSNLFNSDKYVHSGRDTDFLTMILIQERDIKDVADKFGVTPNVVRNIFNRAVKRMDNHCKTFDERIAKVWDLGKEVYHLKKQLQHYQKKDKTFLPTETKELLLRNIRDFKFNARFQNMCHAADVETMGDLVKFSKRDLMQFRNVGKRTVTQVEDVLRPFGLHLGMDV